MRRVSDLQVPFALASVMFFSALQLACSEAGQGADGVGGSSQQQDLAAGTGASGANLDQTCDSSLSSTGGAIYLYECQEWLDASADNLVDGGGALAVTCLDGAALEPDDPAGTKPALRVVCEADSSPNLNEAHAVYHCVKPLLEDPCSDGHEQAVRDCLSQPYPCQPGLAELGCDSMLTQCPALEPSSCFWAMSAADQTSISNCWQMEQPGESCEDRFMRCAWGL